MHCQANSPGGSGSSCTLPGAQPKPLAGYVIYENNWHNIAVYSKNNIDIITLHIKIQTLTFEFQSLCIIYTLSTKYVSLSRSPPFALGVTLLCSAIIPCVWDRFQQVKGVAARLAFVLHTT